MKKEYHIKVTNTVVGLEQIDGAATEPGTPASPKETADAMVKKSTKEGGTAKAIATHLKKQAISYVTSNYGNLTGDYIAQANISEGVEIGGLIAMGLSSPLGAVVAIGSIAIKVGNRYVDVDKSETISANMRERTGLATGGSR